MRRLITLIMILTVAVGCTTPPSTEAQLRDLCAGGGTPLSDTRPFPTQRTLAILYKPVGEDAFVTMTADNTSLPGIVRNALDYRQPEIVFCLEDGPPARIATCDYQNVDGDGTPISTSFYGASASVRIYETATAEELTWGQFEVVPFPWNCPGPEFFAQRGLTDRVELYKITEVPTTYSRDFGTIIADFLLPFVTG